MDIETDWERFAGRYARGRFVDSDLSAGRGDCCINYGDGIGWRWEHRTDHSEDLVEASSSSFDRFGRKGLTTTHCLFGLAFRQLAMSVMVAVLCTASHSGSNGSS